MTDFEMALRNALRKIYKLAKVCGCFFHFTQAIRKRASQMTGFYEHMRCKPDAETVFYKLNMLPLLREDMIESALETLKAYAEDLFQGFETFVVYFEPQWIQKFS